MLLTISPYPREHFIGEIVYPNLNQKLTYLLRRKYLKCITKSNHSVLIMSWQTANSFFSVVLLPVSTIPFVIFPLCLLAVILK